MATYYHNTRHCKQGRQILEVLLEKLSYLNKMLMTK